MLGPFAAELFDLIDAVAAVRPARLRSVETGRISWLLGSVVEVAGLTEAMADEVILFEGGASGLALDLAPGRAGVALLQSGEGLDLGAWARRSGRVASVPTGEGLLGRVIDPLGRPLDGAGPLRSDRVEPVERPAPAIIERAPVSQPLQTGIKAVDALVPIGRGQRELIIGDRQTGKTAIAIDTILNQRETGIVPVYCAIGQRGDGVARVIATLRDAGLIARSVVVVAGAEEPPGLQYLAPYAATTIAERFMAEGQDALIVYDDLTRHARAYRELSLLLRRPPGREAFPGDIFYLHARLLERATHLRDEAGGGSLTALPIVETQAQNLAAYIPTNLISITDGQIYLSPDLFRRGQLPAVDIGRSVSRVGGKAQLPGFRKVAGPLKLAHAQFEELEAFARFGARLDPETRRQLERGRRVRAMLRQEEGSPIPVAHQIGVLLAVSSGLFDHMALDAIAGAEEVVSAALDGTEEAEALAAGVALDDTRTAALLQMARQALTEAGLGDGDADA